MSDHDDQLVIQEDDEEQRDLEAQAIRGLSNAYVLMREEIGKVIIGQSEVVDEILISLFSRGHTLLVGVPGLAKTLLVSTIAQILHLSFRRIQFTPDLMPSDITGTDVLQDDPETGHRSFQFMQGPLFTNVLLADEINRTPPKTQAALLEAMQERHVTVGSSTYRLPEPFFVLATQNPIEQEGTYPLPEAQLDRFLLQVDVDYPTRAAERDILLATTGTPEAQAVAVLSAGELKEAQTLLRRMPVGDAVVELILDLVRACRPDDDTAPDYVRDAVSWGPGPRAAQALMLLVRARALLDGRLAPGAADVSALARPVLVHRMALNYGARARGENLAALIGRLVDDITSREGAA